MLPVTHGESYTKLHIVLYTLILIAVTLLPYATRMLNWFYLCGAIMLDIGFLYYAIKLAFTKDNNVGMAAFKYSIIYLMVLFIVMLIDHYAFPLSL